MATIFVFVFKSEGKRITEIHLGEEEFHNEISKFVEIMKLQHGQLIKNECKNIFNNIKNGNDNMADITVRLRSINNTFISLNNIVHICKTNYLDAFWEVLLICGNIILDQIENNEEIIVVTFIYMRINNENVNTARFWGFMVKFIIFSIPSLLNIWQKTSTKKLHLNVDIVGIVLLLLRPIKEQFSFKFSVNIRKTIDYMEAISKAQTEIQILACIQIILLQFMET